MSLVGRTRKSDVEKKRKGTYRASRSNLKAPQLAKEIPPMPERVAQSEIASKFYIRVTEHMHKSKVITLQDEIALEQLSLLYAEIVELEKIIQDDGGARTYKSYTKNGITHKTRPEVQQIQESRRQFNAMLQQFGLTPVTRSKVNAEVPEQGDLFGDALSGKATIRKVG